MNILCICKSLQTQESNLWFSVLVVIILCIMYTYKRLDYAALKVMVKLVDLGRLETKTVAHITLMALIDICHIQLLLYVITATPTITEIDPST